MFSHLLSRINPLGEHSFVQDSCHKVYGAAIYAAVQTRDLIIRTQTAASQRINESFNHYFPSLKKDLQNISQNIKKIGMKSLMVGGMICAFASFENQKAQSLALLAALIVCFYYSRGGRNNENQDERKTDGQDNRTDEPKKQPEKEEMEFITPFSDEDDQLPDTKKLKPTLSGSSVILNPSDLITRSEGSPRMCEFDKDDEKSFV